MRAIRARALPIVALATLAALAASCGRAPTPAARRDVRRGGRKPAPFVPAASPPCLERCRHARTIAVAGDHDQLEHLFEDAERAVAADCTREGRLIDLVDCFDTTDPSLEGALDAWVDSRPASWSARVARASYHERLASLHRSTHWANDVTDEQWEGYRIHSERAAADLQEVLRTRPETLPAYILLLRTEGHHADPDLLARAIEVAPYTYFARTNYLWYLQPKWGGSLEEMESFVREAAALGDRYPDLLSLADTLTYTMAEGPWRAGDAAEAERILTKALDDRDSAFLRTKRAQLRAGQRRFADAHADLAQILARRPCHTEALTLEASLLAYQGHVPESRVASEVLAELDPLDTDVRFSLSLLNYREHKLDAVIADLRIVTRYDPLHRDAWNNLGFALLQLGRPAEAEEALTRAIDIHDNFVHTRYKRGKARYLLGKESAFEDLQKFVERKADALATRQEGGDVKARLAWSEKVLAAPRDGTFPFKDEAPD